MSCICGHEEEDHSTTGECQVEGCRCACYEEEEDDPGFARIQMQRQNEHEGG